MKKKKKAPKGFKIPHRVKDHLISAVTTFLTVFAVIFFGSIVDSHELNISFFKVTLVSAIVAGVRAMSKEIVLALTPKK